MKYKPLILFFIFFIGCSKADHDQSFNDNDSVHMEKQIKQEKFILADNKTRDEKTEILTRDNDTVKETKALSKYFAENGQILSAEEQLRQYYAEKGMEYPDNNKTEKYTVDDPVFYSSPSSKPEIQAQNNHADEGSLEENQPKPQRKSTRKVPSQKIIDKLNSSIEEEQDAEPQPEYSDSEPPELILIRFEPDELVPGQEATVVVQAVDNLSGVKSIFGVLKSPSQSAMISFSCALLNPDGTFKGVVKIPDHAEAGQWFLHSVRVTDKVFNTRNYSKNYPILHNSFITVVESDSDITAPKLVSIFIDPPQAQGNEKVNVMVDATDDKSGVYRVYGLLSSPSNNAKLSFACRYSKELNVFEGIVNIPSDAESGFWQVEYLRLEDTAKNAKTYYRRSNPDIFEGAKVDVLTEGSDSKPPVLEDIYITPLTVVYGQSLKIHVKASDDVSGVASVSGRIQSPSAQGYMPFFCKYDSEADDYIAEIIIQQNTEVGLWQIDSLVISDNARNQVRFSKIKDPILQQSNFEVLGE
ncbi:hypothetical protein J7L67_02490 [bacterium]|nr:hypothetical protein [bacterium]